jgi:hypothetical protein
MFALKSRLLLVMLAVIIAALPPRSTAQNPTIAGKWHFVVETEGGERIVDPVFQLDGDRVTGKWNTADVKVTFSGGKLDLAFPYNSEEAGEGTLKIKGELKGDTLTGTCEFEGYTGIFKATRTPDT